MPPANSPSETPVVARDTYLPQLQQLEAPVPDLAATLLSQADSNPPDYLLPPHSPLLREPETSSAERQILDDLQRRRREIVRAQDHEARLNLRRMGPSIDAPTSYSDRVPQRQSLYDWAPAHEGNETDDVGPDHHFLADENAPWQTRSRLRNPHATDNQNVVRRRPTTSSLRLPDYSQTAQSGDLRNLALAQALRRHRPSHPTHPAYDLLDLAEGHDPRGTNVPQERELPRSSSRLVRPPSMINPSDRRQRLPSSELRASIDAYRQRYLHNPTSGSPPPLLPPTSPGPFESVIEYLERLRFVDSYQESVMLAGRHCNRDFILAKNRKDFLLDTSLVEPPPETCWLRAGALFEGSQHASGGPNTITRRLSSNSSPSMDMSPPLSIATSTSTIAPTRHRPSHLSVPYTPLPADAMDHSSPSMQTRTDSWPVKVTIQSISTSPDGSTTLSGEMEAFDVPDRTSPEGKSSITTCLEGEIIDLQTFTLETESFRSERGIDAMYWRKLSPFRELADDVVVQRLTSRDWIAENISRKWVLMRWKETCFITPSDQRLGLTISGFYYVSLRRCDGFVEGLYHDPASAPYQHLVLKPARRGFPAHKFR
ncbi:MAG: hypothetical protein M1817_004789 [Caeruleum heppii]|nr:MAG: hypothetical protein M1817_004789 [Caeruleum heppii]